MYSHIEEAFKITGIPWTDCYQEDRGDGALIIMPPELPAHLLLDPLAHHLNAVLRQDNRTLSRASQMRLRMAAHSGIVHSDAHGVSGHALIHLFRLLEAPAFKKSVELSPMDLGLIVSNRLYRQAHELGGYVDPARYRRVRLKSKETRAIAWIWQPPTVPIASRMKLAAASIQASRPDRSRRLPRKGSS
jgi:hypothetical protein